MSYALFDRFTAWTLALIPLALLVAAMPAHAQEPADLVLEPTFLKRVAAVAEGYPGQVLYAVVGDVSPHPLSAVFVDYPTAREYSDHLGENFHVIGPISTSPEDIPTRILMLGHTRDTQCPPDEARVGAFGAERAYLDGGAVAMIFGRTGDPCYMRAYPAYFDDILAVQVEITLRDSTVFREEFTGPDVPDAIFLTLPALDKFYFPHVSNVFGLGFADGLRQSVVDRVEDPR